MNHQTIARLNAEFKSLNSQWQVAGRQLQDACERGESDYRIERLFRDMESIYKRMYLCLDQMDSEYESEGIEYSTRPFKDLLSQHRDWLISAARQAGIDSTI